MDTIINLNGKSFCAFCGNEITTNENGQALCQCTDAQQYRKALSIKLQLEIEASKVMNAAPKPKYGLHTIISPIEDCKAYQEQDEDIVPSNPL